VAETRFPRQQEVDQREPPTRAVELRRRINSTASVFSPDGVASLFLRPARNLA
jgi:hypothetical protein